MIRQVIAMNVRALRDHVFAELPNETARNKQLAEAAGTTLSQIQRVIAQDLGTSVDFVEQLARALGCRPQDLLTPYFLSSAGQTPPEHPPDAELIEQETLRRRSSTPPPRRARR
jgi:DNA-binding Xre family transcriptional regulator